MGLNRDGLVVFHKKWFSGTPQNAVKASGTLTMTGIPVVTEIVTVGTDVYEIVADAGDIADPSYIPVALGVTLTADNAVTKLAEAINANSTVLTAVADTDDDTVVLTYNLVGTEGNAVVTTTDFTNGDWGAASLADGQYATPCKTSMAMIEISGTKYLAINPVDKYTESGWYTIALS
jgi:hypothetical protein